MDVILDEISLIPCEEWHPARRIQTLASTLQALDNLGCMRSLRSVRAAADQDIGQGHGLRHWCFRGTKKEAGLFVARRLDKQPFIDGPDGLFGRIEGERAIEGHALGKKVIGLAYAALQDAPVVALGSAEIPGGANVEVDLITLDAESVFQESVQVCRLITELDVVKQNQAILCRIELSITDGVRLLERAYELFPQLRFGRKAREQIAVLRGNEAVFHQLFRHLMALQRGAVEWDMDVSYSPAGSISWSPESTATLSHRNYGPMRDFPVPDGFNQRRWSLHTKLSGGNDVRLYFDAERVDGEAVVLIGYFGDHLPTVKFAN